jgi:hypothetical protein
MKKINGGSHQHGQCDDIFDCNKYAISSFRTSNTDDAKLDSIY